MDVLVIDVGGPPTSRYWPQARPAPQVRLGTDHEARRDGEYAGILADEQFGAAVLCDATRHSHLTACEDCARVVAAARRGGRDRVGCIILGRAADEPKVREWLTTAAGVPGFIGFAVGRTTFWEPLVNWRQKTITREAAVAEVARRDREWVHLFAGVR